MDAQGLIGWAPASYLVPVNENDLEEEAEENENLIEQERGESISLMVIAEGTGVICKECDTTVSWLPP